MVEDHVVREAFDYIGLTCADRLCKIGLGLRSVCELLDVFVAVARLPWLGVRLWRACFAESDSARSPAHSPYWYSLDIIVDSAEATERVSCEEGLHCLSFAVHTSGELRCVTYQSQRLACVCF